MISKEQHEQLLTTGKLWQRLEALKEYGPRKEIHGICCNVRLGRVMAENEIDKDEVYKTWGEYTGNDNCPVPHPEKNPAQAYGESREEKWNKEHAYAQARWRLVDHMLQYAKERDI